MRLAAAPGAQIQQHDDKKKQDHHRSGIDQNLEAMKLTTRLSALETGLGCAITETPKISITRAKTQKISGLIAWAEVSNGDYFLSFHL